ncbi:RING/U-box superfamily protein [Striga asiatica]|uniref:RING/U-box superfamily protein n=1 Tax=Striga asiatica TaxID=4170 RepID=A0A5A7Q2Q8_STRAF|nr:RING/U-box superfamily protein [Striga asiatica]
MENPNGKAAADTTTGAGAEGNPSNDAPRVGDGEDNRRRRTPFTDLSQVDADLALARTLQEQERAYMMLRMNSGIGSDYESWEAESYGNEDVFDNDDFEDASGEDYDGSDVEVDDETEDAFGVHAPEAGDESGNENAELDPSAFPSDEAYARALQDAEERELAARLLALAGINNMVAEDEDEDEGEDEEEEEHDGNLQDTWEEVDPDELSYEELIALGDVVGTESRGLSEDTIASLPSIKYQSQGTHEGSDSFVLYAVLKCQLQGESSVPQQAKDIWRSDAKRRFCYCYGTVMSHSRNKGLDERIVSLHVSARLNRYISTTIEVSSCSFHVIGHFEKFSVCVCMSVGGLACGT